MSVILALTINYFTFIIETDQFLGGSGIFIGAFSGIFGGAYFIDKFKKRFLLLSIVNFCAFGALLILFMIMEGRFAEKFNSLAGAILIASIIISGMIVLILLVELTTIMERGRITVVTLIIGSIAVGLFYFFLNLPILPIFPILLPAVLGAVFYKFSLEEKVHENAEASIEEESIEMLKDDQSASKGTSIIPKVISIGKYKIIVSNVKYYILGILYGFICGLIIPIDLFVELFLVNREYESLVFIAVLSSVLIIIGGLIIGFVFDYFGKKITLSVMTLIISIANFFNIFNADSSSQINFTIISSFSIFVFFVLTPLILGDIGRKSKMGKLMALWIMNGFAGLVGGTVFKINLLYSLIEQYGLDFIENFEEINKFIYFNYSTTSFVFMACILLLFIISFIKEEISIREYNWPESLIKLYIIHESGILIHEYTFKESEETIDSDLVSGGIVGLVEMLREITKENTRLRTIDHGTKKLIFRWNASGKAIFVLMVEYESLIVRQKLSLLVNAFEETYEKLLDQTLITGVDLSRWAGVSDLVEFYLTRKKADFLGLKELIAYIEKHGANGLKMAENGKENDNTKSENKEDSNMDLKVKEDGNQITEDKKHEN